jgi:hypothetical protein
MLQLGNHMYCKYCGSTELVIVQVGEGFERSRGIQGEVGLDAPFRAKISPAVNTKKINSYGSTRARCTKCRNINDLNISDADLHYFFPLHFTSTNPRICVIPYTLRNLLNDHGVEDRRLQQKRSVKTLLRLVS